MRFLTRLPSSYGYDADGRLTSLQHSQGTYPIAGYGWTYYDDGTVKDFNFDNQDNAGESAHCGYDADQQLTSAAHSDSKYDESYQYDNNGNQKQYDTGGGNEILSDGTYTYGYDKNGNRTSQISIAEDATDDDGNPIPNEETDYTYDYRNRLTDVKVYSYGGLSQEFTYTYDVFDRRIAKSVDTNEFNSKIHPVVTQWVYDDGATPLATGGSDQGQGVTDPIILQLDGAGNATDRFLYGPAVDQILADEQVGSSAGDQVLWALTDNQNTVRDLVRFTDAASGQALTTVNHLLYDSFGKVISETRTILGDMNGDGVFNNLDISAFELAVANAHSNGAAFLAVYSTVTDWQARGDLNQDGAFNNYDISPFEQDVTKGTVIYLGHPFLIGYAGMVRDDEIGMLQDGHREYDPKLHVFTTPDPANADSENTYRYVFNSTPNATDPDGLRPGEHWWDNDWTDWINPLAYVAASGDRLGDKIGTAWSELTDPDPAFLQMNRIRQERILRDAADPNSRTSNREYATERTAAIADGADEAKRSAVKLVEGEAAPMELTADVVMTVTPLAEIGAAEYAAMAERGALKRAAAAAAERDAALAAERQLANNGAKTAKGYGMAAEMPKARVPPAAERTPLPTVSVPRTAGVQANKAAGDAVRDLIAAREAPALTEQAFTTVGGVRRVDVLKLGDELVGIESKVGRTALDSRVRQELARDWWLQRQGQLDRVMWEFTPSGTTGAGGPTAPLLQKLQKLGFDVRINP